MTKIEEKIDKAADVFAEQEAEIGTIDRDALYKGFYHGAKWALSHQWISVDEALPDKKSCECICYDGERVFFAKWIDDTPQGLSGWDIAGLTKPPIAWMPIPPLPEARKEGEV